MTRAFSVGLWVKDMTANWYLYLVDLQGVFSIGSVNQSNAVYFQTTQQDVAAGTNRSVRVVCPTSVFRRRTGSDVPGLDDGNWHFVAATFNYDAENPSRNFQRLYVDGSLVAETTEVCGNLVAGARPLSFGGANCGGTDAAYWMEWGCKTGRFAEFTLWDRALSPEEVSGLVSRRSSGDETGLVGYWSLDSALLSSDNLAANGPSCALKASSGVTATESVEDPAFPLENCRYVVSPQWAAAHGYEPSSNATCRTWADAAVDIQAAVDKARSGEEVRVMPGIYTLTAPVVVSGKRDFRVVSFDPDAGGLRDRARTVLDGQGVTRCLEVLPFRTETGNYDAPADSNCEVSGFTLANGRATTKGGGALLVGRASGADRISLRNRIVDCIFTNCQAVAENDSGSAFGGGVYIGTGRANVQDGGYVSNCVFIANSAQSGTSGGAASGGGVCVATWVDPHDALTWEYRYGAAYDCDFVGNETMGFDSSCGGAVSSGSSLGYNTCVLRRSRFKDNAAKKRTGATASTSAGHVSMGKKSFMEGCVFSGTGQGVYGAFVDMDADTVMTNCLFSGCVSSSGFGVVHVDGKGVSVVGCALTDNAFGSAAFFLENGQVNFRQCLLADNGSSTALTLHGGGAKSTCENCTFVTGTGVYPIALSSDVAMTNVCVNCLFDNAKALVGSDAYGRCNVLSNCLVRTATKDPCPLDGTVTVADPGFADPAAGDYRLSRVRASAAVDGGMALDWHDGATDIAGRPRVVGAAVDIGAYERQPDDPAGVAVRVDATGEWADSVTTIEEAFDRLTASCNTILVRPGTYSLTRPLTNSVKQLIVRSCDENGDRRPGEVILDGSKMPGQSALYSDLSSSAPTLDGLVFRNFSAPNGAAVCLTKVGAYRILDCTFEDNVATSGSGGAVFSYLNVGGLISNCVFRGNSAAINGGAVFAQQNAELRSLYMDIRDSLFVSNRVVVTSGSGGAIGSARCINLYDCVFTDNFGGQDGGEAYVGKYSRVERCRFSQGVGPASPYGSLLKVGNEAEVRDCLFGSCCATGTTYGAVALGLGSTNVLTNCRFLRSTRKSYVFADSRAKGQLRNCLFEDEVGSQQGVFFGYDTGTLALENCTLVCANDHASLTTANMTYVNCLGNYDPPASAATNCLFTGTLSACGFVDAAHGDYRLSVTSPAVDVGLALDWHDGATDIAGGPRVMGAAVDLGAYERQPEFVAATCDDIVKTYDGQGVSSAVTVTDPSDGSATVVYSTDGEIWTNVPPSFVNAGAYEVRYRASAKDYHTLTGVVTVTIARRAITLTSESATWRYDGEYHNFPGVTVSGEGLVPGETVSTTNLTFVRDVGTYPNQFHYWFEDESLAANYDVTSTYGTLTVTRAPAAVAQIDGVAPETPVETDSIVLKGHADGEAAVAFLWRAARKLADGSWGNVTELSRSESAVVKLSAGTWRIEYLTQDEGGLWSDAAVMELEVGEIARRPDVSLYRSDIRFLDADGSRIQVSDTGRVVTVALTVRNLGTTSVQGEYGVYMCEGILTEAEATALGDEDARIVASTTFVGLAAGQNLACSMPWKVGCNAAGTELGYQEGARPYTFVVRSLSSEAEARSDNNMVSAMMIVGDPRFSCELDVSVSAPATCCRGCCYSVSGRTWYDWLGEAIPAMGADVTLVLDDAIVGTTYTTSPSGSYCLGFVAPDPGTHTLTVKISDGYSVGTASRTFVVEEPDEQGHVEPIFLPNLRITSLETTGSGVYVRGLSHDVAHLGGEVGVRVQIVNDGNQPTAEGFRIVVTACEAGGSASPVVLGTKDVAAGLAVGAVVEMELQDVPATDHETTWTLRAVADDLDAVAELSETDNCTSRLLTVLKDRPDLYCTTPTFSVSKPVVGEAVVVRGRVRNGGQTAADEPFQVALYVDDKLLDTWSVSTSLAVGEGIDLEYVFDSTDIAPGSHVFRLTADIGNDVEENGENNNSASNRLYFYPPYPVVFPYSLSASPYPSVGKACVLTAEVRNDGGVPYAGGSARFCIGGAADGAIGSGTVGPIAAKGGTTSSTCVWTPASGGKVTVTVEVEGRTYARTFDLDVPPPNLRVVSEDLSLDPGEPSPGEDVLFRAMVRNVSGTTAATNVTVAFAVTEGEVYEALTTVAVPYLAAGGSVAVDADVPYRATAGLHVLKVSVLDGSGTDASLSDNEATRSFGVGVPVAEVESESLRGIVGEAVDLTCRTVEGISGWTWTVVERPAGSAAGLTSADKAHAQFVPDVAGTYRFSLVVTRNGLDSEAVEVTLDADRVVIMATSGTGGSITPSGRQVILAGTAPVFSFQADAGHVLAGVEVDGEPVDGSAGSYAFPALDRNHVIDVRWLGAIACSADDVSKTYDGQDVSVDVTVTNPSDGSASVAYSADGKTWTNVPPTFVDAGEYETLYRITAANFATVTGAVTVTISPKQLTDEMVTLDGAVQTYDGTPRTPAVTVADGVPSIITENDYAVTYSNNVEAGEAAAIVTGRNNYFGTVFKTFTVREDRVTVTVDGRDESFLRHEQVTFSTAASVTNGTTNVVCVGWIGTGCVPAGGTAATVTFAATDDGTLTWLYATNYWVGVSVSGPGRVDGVTNGWYRAGTALSFGAVADDWAHVVSCQYRGSGISLHQTDSRCDFSGTLKGPFSSDVAFGNDVINFANADLILSQGEFTYDGMEKEPELTVAYGGKTVPPSMYTVGYQDNVDAGTEAYAVVMGVSPHKGFKVASFTIDPRPLAASMVTMDAGPFVYDGVAKTPTVTVTDGDPSIIGADDYDVAYEDNVDVGDAKAVITGKRNYTGTVEVPFVILAATIACDAQGYEGVYDGLGHGISVSTEVAGAEILYAMSENGPYAPEPPLLTNVCATTTWFRLSAPYHVTVTNTATVTITPKALTEEMVTLSEEKFVYDGTAKEPVVTVADGDPSILRATDYDVSYANNVGAGEASVVVTGKGNYNGSVTRTFAILRADNAWTEGPTLEGWTYGDEPAAWTAAAVDGTVTVTYDGGAADVPVDAGEHYATFVVGPTANYGGLSTNLAFAIAPKALTEEMVTLSEEKFVYDGTAKEPTVTVSDPDATLTADDYEISCADNVNAGTARVIVTGKRNYTGTVEVPFAILAATITCDAQGYEGVYDGLGHGISVSTEVAGAEILYAMSENGPYAPELPLLTNVCATTTWFRISARNHVTVTNTATVTITPKALTEEMVTLAEEEFVYDGTAKEPVVTVADGDPSILRVTDYDVSYANNVDAGDASVVVTGKGNYSGTVTKTFAIAPKALTEEMVTLSEEEFVYDGTAKEPTVTVSDPDATLTADDYEISCADNVNAGTARVTVTGRRNYTGTVTKTFVIAAAELRYLASGYAGTYDGQGHAIAVSTEVAGAVVTYALSADGPYQETPIRLSNACRDVKVWFRIAADNYRTVVDNRKVTIAAKALADGMVSSVPASVVYDGTSHSPAVTVTDGVPNLVTCDDYLVSYVDNVDVGLATIVVRGRGNYSGIVFRTFEIVGVDEDAPDWTPVAQSDTMVVMATVFDAASGEYVEEDGSLLAAFSEDGQCRGVALVDDGPAGRYFQLSVGIASATESNLVLRVWNAATGVESEIAERIACNPDKQIGAIAAPRQFEIGAYSASVSLRQGWNWISLGLEPTNAAPSAVFADADFADNDVIVTATKQATYYGGKWYPADFRLEPCVAYMVKKSGPEPISVIVSGTVVKDGVTVEAGWNWFGPSTVFSREIADVAHSGGFADEDIVKGVSSSTIRYSGSWYPSTFALVPGVGYKARLARSGVLGFNGAVVPSLGLKSMKLASSGANGEWAAVKQENVASVYLSVTNRVLGSGARLALFAGNGECRGVAGPIEGPGGTCFSVAAGVAAAGENLSVKVMTENGETLVSDAVVSVSPSARVGTIAEPMGIGVDVEVAEGTVAFVSDAMSDEPILNVRLGGETRALTLSGDWTNHLAGLEISAATFNETGRNGIPVWQSYVLGVDPYEEKPIGEQIRATIEVLSDGTAVVRCEPDMSSDANRKDFVRYTTLGKQGLSNDIEWVEVTDGNRKDMRFFKILIEVK